MQSGSLVAYAMAYTLFSPVDVQVEFLDASGNILGQQRQDHVFASSTSGYVDYDAASQITLTQAQDVYVHVYARNALSSATFPAGASGISGASYYAVTVSRGQPTTALFALNARCETADNFGPYPDQGEAPPMGSGKGIFGCGSIDSGNGPDDHDPGSPDNLIRIMNLALLLLIAAAGHKILARPAQIRQLLPSHS
jgi:hypothetical protein